MIRTPDIPVAEPKEFDPETFAMEKEWLIRIQEGKILVSHTKGELILRITTAIIISIIIGGSLGGIITILTRSFVSVIIPVILTFFISLYFLRGDFSRLEIDREREQLLYEGTISFGGEYRSTRYRGPIQVVEATLLVRIRQMKWIPFSKFYSQPYIRFVTRSGYLRVTFDPQEELKFLHELQQLDLIDIEEMKTALDKAPVRVEPNYNVYFEKKFDRSEFLAEFKRKKEEEKMKKEEEKKLKRKELLDKSKKLKEQD